jgi:phage terminase large subunit GpA-like protein
VDTGGHHTKAAYEFCRTRWSDHVWGIKGRGGSGVPIWPVWLTRSKSKTPVAIIGIDAAKDAIYARLKLSAPGPGFIHFRQSLDAEYFRQLTAERVVTTFVKGRPVRSYQVRKGVRNETLDCMVYATAALHGLIQMRGLRLNDESARPTAAQRPVYKVAAGSYWDQRA